MKISLLLGIASLVATGASPAAVFTCTVLPGTYEPHGGGHIPSIAQSRGESARTNDRANFTFSIDGDRVSFGVAMAIDVKDTRQPGPPPYNLTEVAAGPGIVRAFSGGTLDTLTGKVRVTRAHMWVSPLRGRFVLHVFDSSAQLPLYSVSRRERFKADCGVGPIPLPLDEYVPLLKRQGIWTAGHNGWSPKQGQSNR